MKITENERRFYNVKLPVGSFKDELKKQKIDKKEIIISVIGIFVGFIIKSLVNVSAHISNYFGIFIIEILIIAAGILIVRTIVWAAEKYLRRN